MTHQLYNLFFARNTCDNFCLTYDIIRIFYDIYSDIGRFFYDIGISHNDLERSIISQ